jgi:hypothetical protein
MISVLGALAVYALVGVIAFLIAAVFLNEP